MRLRYRCSLAYGSVEVCSYLPLPPPTRAPQYVSFPRALYFVARFVFAAGFAPATTCGHIPASAFTKAWQMALYTLKLYTWFRCNHACNRGLALKTHGIKSLTGAHALQTWLQVLNGRYKARFCNPLELYLLRFHALAV
jgi:hypothetical protein